MSDEIIFEEPPTPARGNGPSAGSSPLGKWLASLRDHPGYWARWSSPVWSGTTTTIKRGEGYGVKPGEFEVALRKADGGKFHLYARYVGDQS